MFDSELEDAEEGEKEQDDETETIEAEIKSDASKGLPL